MKTVTESKKKMNTTQKELYRLVENGYTLKFIQRDLKKQFKTTKETFSQLVNGEREASEDEFSYLLHLSVRCDYLGFYPAMNGASMTDYVDKHGV